MLRATQVDMIFIEDGVTFKNIERVLRIVAELYDVHAGRGGGRFPLPRPAEGQGDHLRVRTRQPVPFRSLPEPKFDDLSRVRVLHIFRDRGGHEELVDRPFDSGRPPLLLPLSHHFIRERSVSYSWGIVAHSASDSCCGYTFFNHRSSE